MDIQNESLPEFKAGNGTVGTTAAKLTGAVGFPVRKHIVVRANTGNGNVVTVSHSDADAANGFILAAGEQTPPLYVDSTDKVWVRGGAAAQGFSWVAS